MSEELGLVTQLAIILVAAGVMTVISRALKQPLILGYIVAGFLVGPHLGLFPQFSQETVKVFYEISQCIDITLKVTLIKAVASEDVLDIIYEVSHFFA